MLENNDNFNLIVTIVDKGVAEDVIALAKKGGAEGGTILNGRGAGCHDTAKILGILIEPEKDIVLTLIEKEKTDAVLEYIADGLELDKPGKGIAFVLNVPKVVGIVHKM